jgi:cytochrome P450
MSRDLPGTLADWQRTYGDVVHLRLWPEHTVVVTDPQLVRELLVTHHDSLIRWERGTKVFSQVHGHSVLTTEGDAWQRKRQALQPGFTPKAVHGLVPGIVGIVDAALADWPSRAADWPMESALTSLAMDVIVQLLFSAEIGQDGRLAEVAVRVVSAAANAEFYWPASLPDWVPWKRAKREALQTLKGLIEQHLQARLRMAEDAWPDDLLSRLLRLHLRDTGMWPLQAVRDECMTTFLAGHETAAATLTWWAWCMASNPSAQHAARAEVAHVPRGRAPTVENFPALRFVAQTIEETMRLYPAAPVLISRRATRPITLGPWQLPARTLFMLPVQLMHRDPRWFPEPDDFQPDRFASDAPAAPRGASMPFGTGPRVCLGRHLAMTEMTVVAAMVLQRFTISVPEGMVPPRPLWNVTLRPERPLCLDVARIAATHAQGKAGSDAQAGATEWPG